MQAANKVTRQEATVGLSVDAMMIYDILDEHNLITAELRYTLAQVHASAPSRYMDPEQLMMLWASDRWARPLRPIWEE